VQTLERVAGTRHGSLPIMQDAPEIDDEALIALGERRDALEERNFHEALDA
jgi:hypothetical protein